MILRLEELSLKLEFSLVRVIGIDIELQKKYQLRLKDGFLSLSIA